MFIVQFFKDNLKLFSIFAFLAVCSTIVVSTHSESSAAKNETGGVTVFFRYGGAMHLPACSIRDFPKSIGDASTGSRTNRMQTFCGGGSETLERIDMSEVVGICAGQCSS